MVKTKEELLVTKRHLLLAVFCFIMHIICLTGCKSNNHTIDFSATAVDNGYYNYVAGGRLVFINHKLYYVAVHNNLRCYDNTYIIDEQGNTETIDSDIIQSGSDFDVPRLYQYKDKLYINNYQQDFHNYEYHFDTGKLTISNVNISDYYSEDFSAYSVWDNKGYFPITVECKGHEAYKIKRSNSFTVFQGIIYFTSDGNLYKKQPSADNKAERISMLNGDPWIRLVNENFCYYVDADENNATLDVLYRYSFDSKKQDKLYQGEVNSINTIGGYTFFSTKKGVFRDDGKSCEIISDIIAEGVYIVDDEWIYLTDRNENLYRITRDGSKTEQIGF